MADVAATANAIATAIRGIAPPPPAAAPQSVSLTPFTEAVTENFRVSREQLESSIALAQVPTGWIFKTSFARRCSKLISGINSGQQKHS